MLKNNRSVKYDCLYSHSNKNEKMHMYSHYTSHVRRHQDRSCTTQVLRRRLRLEQTGKESSLYTF